MAKAARSAKTPVAAKRKSTTAPSREKLLKAAFKLFSERGFHATSTKLIAETAGVNEALISRHFESKDNLFTTVVREQLHVQPVELPYPARATFEEEAVSFVNSLMDECLEKREFLRMLIAHSLHERKFSRQIPNELGRPNSPAFRERVAAFQKRGLLPKKLDAERTEHILRNLCVSAILFLLLEAVEPKTIREELAEGARRFALGCATQ